jgi:hypothetical protein
MICAAIIYNAYTRPGRYYFPNTWRNLRVADTATGKMYLVNTNDSFFIRNAPLEIKCFKYVSPPDQPDYSKLSDAELDALLAIPPKQ